MIKGLEKRRSANNETLWNSTLFAAMPLVCGLAIH